jgi:hypothetical protein
MANGKNQANSESGSDGCDCPPISEKDAPLPPKKAATGHGEGYSYALDRFVPKVDERDNVLLPIANYRAAMAEQNWTRVFLADAITGRPGEFVQLWRIPAGDATPAKMAKIRDGGAHNDFERTMASFDRMTSTPMPYDPNEDGRLLAAPGRKTPSLLLADVITVKPGAMARFMCVKQNFFIPTITAPPYNWKLAGASAVDGGKVPTVLQIWELPDADRLAFTMQRIGQDTTYRNCLQPCIADENQQLLEVIDWT